VTFDEIAARVHGPSGLPAAIIIVGSIEDLIAVIECPAKGCVALRSAQQLEAVRFILKALYDPVCGLGVLQTISPST
jgi:hypothetical protein